MHVIVYLLQIPTVAIAAHSSLFSFHPLPQTRTHATTTIRMLICSHLPAQLATRSQRGRRSVAGLGRQIPVAKAFQEGEMSLTTTSATLMPSTCFWGAFISYNSSSPSVFLPSVYLQRQRPLCCAFKTGSQESYGPDLLRKPIVSPSLEIASDDEHNDNDNAKGMEKQLGFDSEGDGERWVDWEDQILEVTVPLVGFVRMILHSGKYQSGDRLSPDHERMILERLLPYHPESEKKIGCGVDYITIGYHPQFEDSRCLFIVRKDGELVDFSYWKCIKGFIRRTYPHYADSFILKHFRRQKRYE